jgi:hypothetical protein
MLLPSMVETPMLTLSSLAVLPEPVSEYIMFLQEPTVP